MTEQELIEQLADKEHASWARWQDYFFSKCHMYVEGEHLNYSCDKVYFSLPRELVERWKRQIQMPYAELSEREKQSDRDEVAHILPIIREYAQSQCGDTGDLAAMAWGLANAHESCILDIQRQVSLLHDEVFCTNTNRPGDNNKTLLGKVHQLYQLVYSLQGEDVKPITD